MNHHTSGSSPVRMVVHARYEPASAPQWRTTAALQTGDQSVITEAEFLTDWAVDRAYLGEALRVHVNALDSVAQQPDDSEVLRYQVSPRSDYQPAAARP